MKSDSLKISKVFSSGGDIHYVLPYFQREYTWGKTNWETLLNDAQAIHDEMQSPTDEVQPLQEPEHFLGALVVVNDGTRNGTVTAFKLVDGQQRLTTISLLLCALGRIVADTHPGLARKVQKLLVNGDELGDIYFKILPTAKYNDRVAYTSIIQGEAVPETESQIPHAYEFFYKELRQKIMNGTIDPDKFFIVLTNCFQVVFIDLNQNESPYRIFESLNAKGKPLTQADLVRNYIAMKLPGAGQEKVFNEHWAKIEDMLQEKRMVGRSRLGELTAFLRHYLAMRSGVLCSEEHVYARFRDRIEKEFSDPAAFVKEIAVLRRFAGYYNKLLRPENERNPEIREAMQRLNVLEISTAYPFLLAAFDAYSNDALAPQDFKNLWALLENYLVRRFLVGESTNFLNRLFPTLWSQIDQESFTLSLRKALSIRNYPNDPRVRQALLTRSLSMKNPLARERTILILDTINRHLSSGSGGYTVLDRAATVEHVLPQTPGVEWQEELGSMWKQIQQDFCDTFGNFTLVTQEWNSSLSNAPFSTKKPKLAAHALRLNSDYFSRDIPKWNEDAIQDRASYLAEKVLAIWPALADAPVEVEQSTRKPVALTICGESLPVSTWADVLRQTAEYIVRTTDDFTTIAQRLPSYVSEERFPYRCYQLSNGWWIMMNLSAKDINKVCSRLIQAAGISDSNWEVTEVSEIEANPAQLELGEVGDFRDECIEVISRYLGVSLNKEGRVHYTSRDRQHRVVCSVSKEYVTASETSYWYAFHPSHAEFLSETETSFIAYGCASPDKVVLIPYKIFQPLTQFMATTIDDQTNRHYWHVKIHESGNRIYLGQSLGRERVDITRFLLP